jgi:hypothetical protein
MYDGVAGPTPTMDSVDAPRRLKIETVRGPSHSDWGIERGGAGPESA